MGNIILGIWSFYTGVLRLVGETILILSGIALCGYTMVQQFEKLHSTGLDAALFAVGISLVAFRMLRRLVWAAIGLSIPWIALVAGGIYLLVEDVYRFQVTPDLIALALVPPIFMAVWLEFLPKSKEEVAAEANEPHLEITIDEPVAEESLIEGPAREP
jgi:hypothetical protein